MKVRAIPNAPQQLMRPTAPNAHLIASLMETNFVMPIVALSVQDFVATSARQRIERIAIMLSVRTIATVDTVDGTTLFQVPR